MNIINTSIYNNIELLPEDISGWNGNSVVFHQLIDEIKPKIIIEIGTWKGQSAINMARYIKENKYETKILCVDTWLGALEFWHEAKETPERNLLLKNGYPQIYYQFISNVIHSGVQDIILPFPNTSDIAFKYFLYNNIKANLIYVDASHDEDDVYRDIKNYYQLLENNGIIFGDDYYGWPSVNKAVNNFLTRNNVKHTVLENNFWIIKK
jgi:SAM-dependent methyltransferase